MSHRALLAAAGSQAKLYSEDVFSAYPYIGNSTSQTITNGIDLTKGGLVWVKDRSNAFTHILVDTLRGPNNYLGTNASSSEASGATVTGFSGSGFTVGNSPANSAPDNVISWTFRRSPRFFDVVTWTGDGTSNRQIPHALGIAPGMVTAKRRDAAGDWAVWHRSATGDLYLDTTAAQTASFTQITAASATTFSVSGNANINGATYVAYAWAHDPDTVNGIVQCGSFTTDASGNATVSLGWEPQYLMVRAASSGDAWYIQDNMRGMPVDAGVQRPFLQAGSSNAETAGSFLARPTPTGFNYNNSASTTYIYLAIRRGPMRTPTSGASVYNAIARTGTDSEVNVTGAGLTPDLVFTTRRSGGYGTNIVSRLTANLFLYASGPYAESSDITVYPANAFGSVMDGIRVGSSPLTNSGPMVHHFFRRASKFFDVVCYKGTGANQTLAHNLGVAPKMMWIKDRTTANDWAVYHQSLGAGQILLLDSLAGAAANTAYLNNTAPTAANFTVGSDAKTNTSGDNYVAYLFGELAGVSKIGSYIGTGAAQTINCGFTNGARFVLIHRTDATTDHWLLFDSVRGIVVGNDPALLIDTTQAEVTTIDFLAPQSVGFGIASTANTAVNAVGATYAFLAIA